MATDLTNVAVSTGYVQLLHIDGGVGGSVNRVYDGDGTGAPLRLSTTVVEILDGANYLDVASHDGTYGLKLGGTLVTSSATELNYNDITTLGTAQASKVLTTDANIDVTGIRNLTATGTITAANFTGSGDTTIGDAADDTVAINSTITTDLIFEGATANDFELTLTPGDPTADRTLTLPDATDTLVGKATTDTLTNKTLTSPVLNTADINTPDIDGGTVDAITSLTVANNVDIGNYTLTSNGLTIDGTFTDGTLSIASGSISSAVNGTFSGTVSFGTLTDSGESISITKFVDELDGISANDNDTTVPTSAAVKDYVDTKVTGEDLDITTDSGTIAIDLDSETLTLTGGTGVDTSAATNTVTFALDLNELTTETTIADADFIAMVDATDSGSGKITFENLEDAIFSSVSGDILIAEDGVATIQANSVALATDTTGDFVSTITAGTGLTSTGATSGENIAHSLSVDASQTQVTAVGALDAGSITSGFGSIDIGSSNFTTTGTVSTGALTATANLDIGAYTLRASNFLADSQTSGQVAFYGTDGVLSGDTDLTFSGSTLTVTDLTVSGTLSTTGTVQEISTTNLNVEDPLILLNKYDSQPSANVYDAGFVIKRGSTDTAPANVAFIWDESENTFSLVDTTEDGTTAGNVVITDYENLRVGALTADDASTFTSTISTASGSTIGNLTLANGSITDSSGAISFNDENLSTTGTLSAGAITGTSFVIGSADIGEAELEILDGATVTTAELNIMDGDTAATATTVADADRVVMNDAGVMKQVAVTDLSAYFDDEITAMPNLASVGTLTSLQVDNINIDGNTIISSDTNGNIALTPNGTGEVDISKVDIDSGAIDGTAIGASSASTGAFTTLTASGDVNFDSNTLFVDASNNRVGIGTASPSNLFHVLKSGSAEGIGTFESNNDVSVLIKSTYSATNNAGIYIEYDDAHGSATDGFKAGIPTGTNNYSIGYGTLGDFSSSTDSLFTIDSSGNVGIGTSPSVLLDIGSGASSLLRANTFLSNRTSTAGLGVANDENSGEFGPGYINLNRDDTATAKQITFGKNGSVHSYFETSTSGLNIGGGNVGIGETNPSAKLVVTENKDNAVGAALGNIHATGYGVKILGASDATRYALTVNDNNDSQVFLRVRGDGNVGIGTSSPATNFHVTDGGTPPTLSGTYLIAATSATNAGIAINAGNTQSSIIALGDTDSQDVGLILYNHSDNSMRFNTNSSERMRIDSSGNVGIGTSSPSYQLHLSTDSAAKPSTNTWTISSDERLKEDIEDADLDICYDVVKNLPLKRFKWRDEVYSGEQVADRRKIGWIAQDVESVFPKAVNQYEFKYNQVYEDEIIPAQELIEWENKPTDENTKDEIKAWMDSNELKYNSGDTKQDLLDKIPSVKQEAQEERTEQKLVSEDVIPDCRGLNADQIYAVMFGAIQKLQAKVEALENA